MSSHAVGLGARELDRYSRHLSLPGFGLEGQRRLRAASVLVVGAGGLGAPILHYLAAAGVGSITIIDDDIVEASNLQRQIIHRDADIGRAKVASARDALLRLDPELSVTALRERLSPDNALDLFAAHDIVLDGADNFATRYLSNDAAELTGTPLIWGTIFRFEGQVSTFAPGHGPMLRDLFPDIPDADSVPNCAEGGVLGVLCGTVGSAMATEAIKVLARIGTPLIGRLWRYDALEAEYSTLRFSPDPDRPPVTDLAEVALACSAPTAPSGPTGSTEPVPEIAAEDVDLDAVVLVDIREVWEREISSIPGSIHVPLSEVESSGWEALAEAEVEVPSDGSTVSVVVHCQSGVRSASAVRRLMSDAPSVVELVSLSGGILAWQAAR